MDNAASKIAAAANLRATGRENSFGGGGERSGREGCVHQPFRPRSSRVVVVLVSGDFLVVVGDKKGRVGVGVGQGGRSGGRNSVAAAKWACAWQMVLVALKDTTIPHEVFLAFGGAKVSLRPASPGTGIIAGKVSPRAVLSPSA